MTIGNALDSAPPGVPALFQPGPQGTSGSAEAPCGADELRAGGRGGAAPRPGPGGCCDVIGDGAITGFFGAGGDGGLLVTGGLGCTGSSLNRLSIRRGPSSRR